LSVSGGTGPYTYVWSNAETTQDISGLSAGTYSVTITDANGCTSTASTTITEPAALTNSFTQTDVLCFGNSTGAIDLSVSGGTGPYTYAWSNAETTQDISGLSAGTYSVTITDANGCTSTASTTITEPASALTNSLTQTDVLCFGNSTGAIDLSVSGGTGPYTYAWSNAETTQDITGLPAGTYSVTITDANGCASTASTTISQPASGITISYVTTDVACFGDSSGSIDLSLTGGVSPFSYSWNTGDTTQDLSNLVAGAYSVTVSDSTGCQNTASITVSEPSQLGSSTIITDVSCNGGNDGAIDLTVSGGTSPYTYVWNTGATTQDLSGLVPGTYSVTITDANGCTATNSATIDEPSSLSVSYTTTDVVCFGNSTGAIDLTASGGLGVYRYDWDDINGSNNPSDRSNLPAGTYTVTVRNLSGCTTAPIPITINEPAAALTVSLDSKTDILCNGGNNGAIEITAGGGTAPYTYNWTDLSGSNNIEDRSNITAGNYSVVVTDANGCSTAPLNITISEPDLLALSIASQTSGLCSGDNSGIIDISVTGGVSPYTYDWSDLAGTDNGQDRSNLSSGSYTVTVMDANACTASVSVTINALQDVQTPVFAAGDSTERCQGSGVVTYSATATYSTSITYALDAASLSAGNSINSSTGAVTFTAGWTGYSTITATAFGCNGPTTATHVVEVKPSVTTPVFVSGATSIRCQGADSIFYVANVNNATSLKYKLDNFSKAGGNKIDSLTGRVIFVAAWSGTTVITATAQGCNGPKSATHTVTVTPTVGTPVFVLGATSVRCQGATTEFFTANSTNSTGMSYDLDAASKSAGLTINTSTSEVTFPAGWTGTSIITATATGCNGPRSSSHSVNTTNVNANDDVASGNAGTPIIIPVLANDSGAVNPLSITITAQPTFGFVQIDADGVITYLPNGNYFGTDQFSYSVCSSENGVCCDVATVNLEIFEALNDPCSEASKSKTFYLPFPEDDVFLRNSLLAAADVDYLSDTVRSIVSIKIPYPGNIITYDHWEDGYEDDISIPLQESTEIWGDGIIENGYAPGYPSDIIPAGGYIFIDNQFVYNPRDPSKLFFDGKDKILSSNDIAVSKISGDAGNATGSNTFDVQNVKTNVVDLNRFGQFFIVPFGEDNTLGGTSAFHYTGLFARASEDSTVINLDYDADGNVDISSPLLMEGEVWFYDGTRSYPGNLATDINQANDIKSGASLTSTKNFGVDMVFGGIDHYGTRNMPLYPGNFYEDVYISPAHTTLSSAPVYGFFTNNLANPITVDWTSGTGASGNFIIPAKGKTYLNMNQSQGYRFASRNGEAYTAIAVFDADSAGSSYDWSFNMLPEGGLSTFASIAWAPGSNNGSANYNPVWVTAPTATTIYVKFDGDLSGTSATTSPCGTPYDLAIPINALQSYKILDGSDNDQTGLAVYTCDGTNIAAVWGLNPNGAPPGSPAMDVGYVLEPRCLAQLIIANDDVKDTEPDTPVIVDIQSNDYGFLCTPDVSSVTTVGLLQPSNGTVTVNPDGTVTYTPNPGFQGEDEFEYRLCSQEYSGVCDVALVKIRISDCLANPNENLMKGKVFIENYPDNGVYDGEAGAAGVKVDLFVDANCNGIIDPGEGLVESTLSDLSGNYSFSTENGNNARDNFDPIAGFTGNDGGLNWDNNWTETGDDNGVITGDIRVMNDASSGGMGNAIRLSGPTNAISRTFSFDDAYGAKLKFSYRRQSLNRQGEAVTVSLNGNTEFVMNDGGSVGTDINYTNVVIPLTSYNSNGPNVLQFVTNGSTATNDYFWIDNVELIFWKNPPVCYIAKVDPSNTNGAFSSAALNTQTSSFLVLGTCDKDNYLGVLANLVASNDTKTAEMDVPVDIEVLTNDVVGTPSPSTVSTTGLPIQPANGTVVANTDGTVTYTPNPGFMGVDQFQYTVCSLHDPSVCDTALVTVTIVCASTPFKNEIRGSVYLDDNNNGVYNISESGFNGVDVDLYSDDNGNGIIDGGEAKLATETSDANGAYSFLIDPPSVTLNYLDQFNVNEVANQTNGSTSWASNSWTKIGDFGTFSQNSIRITSANGLKIASVPGNQKGAYRTADLSSAISANLSFNFVESGLDLQAGDYVDVQVASSTLPSGWTTLKRLTGGDGLQSGSASYDISDYMSSVTTIRFISSGNASMDSTDIVYFDNVRINYQVPVPKSYVVRLAQPIPSGYSLTNPLPSPNGVHTASFTASGEGECQNNFGLAVADLAIVKTVNTATPKVGESVIFSIEAQNNGPLDATGVEVSDVLPAGYTLTDVSMSAGTWVYPTWNIGNMANGASETLQLTATVNASGPYSNTAIITGSQPDPFPDDNDSTAITYPIPVADLKVEKLVNDIKPNIGDTVNFTIQAINLGPSTATGITVSDILPSGYTFVNASPSKGIWSSPNWTMDSLILGDTQSLVISARVLSSGDYNNVAIITGNEEDPDTLNNITNRTLTPQLADLSIEISASDTNVFVRDIVTIYVTLKNDGPDTATSVSLQNIVPNGFTNIVNINSGGILVNDTIRWTGITLAPGDSLIFSYETKMASTGPGIEYTTISEVTDADQFDPDSSPNNWLSSEDDYDLLSLIVSEEPPMAINDESPDNTVGADVTLNIIANDSLSDGTNIVDLTDITIDLDPSTPGIQDSLIVPGEGRYDYDTLTGEVTFNPEAGFTTDPTPIMYTLIENSTGLDSMATITITYTEEPPVAVNDEDLDNVVGIDVTLNIIANDSLSDGTSVLTLSVAEVTVDLDPSTPGIQDSLIVPGEGRYDY
ncbi:Ig-like domain-containing protein, partial [Jiulongibacter sediminis]